MEIGILGAGYIGGTLAIKLASAGHRVRIANSKDPSSLTEFHDRDRITPMWAADAVDGVDVAIISIPQKAIASIPADVKSRLHPVPVVIDTCNYYPARDGRIEALEKGAVESVWVASQLGRPVFKAFNNTMAPSLKHKGTADTAQRLALAIAGPDIDHKKTVFALVEQVGFAPVDTGELDQSWRQQPGTPTYCKDMTAEQMLAGLATTVRADVEKYHAIRDEVQDFDTAMKAMGEYM